MWNFDFGALDGELQRDLSQELQDIALKPGYLTQIRVQVRYSDHGTVLTILLVNRFMAWLEYDRLDDVPYLLHSMAALRQE